MLTIYIISVLITGYYLFYDLNMSSHCIGKISFYSSCIDDITRYVVLSLTPILNTLTSLYILIKYFVYLIMKYKRKK